MMVLGLTPLSINLGFVSLMVFLSTLSRHRNLRRGLLSSAPRITVEDLCNNLLIGELTLLRRILGLHRRPFQKRHCLHGSTTRSPHGHNLLHRSHRTPTLPPPRTPRRPWR